MEGIRKIMNHLWLDKNTAEAADFYLSVFKNSKLLSRRAYGAPPDDVETITLEIEDVNLMLLIQGPYFKLNPSISFMVSCTSKDEVTGYWEAFIDGGQALMPLDSYDFSEWYGWVQDKYGVSWQLMYGKEQAPARIRPSLLFVHENCGRADEALQFYTTIFKNAAIGAVARYGEALPDAPDLISYAEFMLEGQHFCIMENNYDHPFAFNEAFSFLVNCDTQQEIDYYWEALSAVPDAEQCGWLKDKFGVSWQIVPTVLNDMMNDADAEALERVTQAFLKMKKFDLAELERAYRG